MFPDTIKRSLKTDPQNYGIIGVNLREYFSLLRAPYKSTAYISIILTYVIT